MGFNSAFKGLNAYWELFLRGPTAGIFVLCEDFVYVMLRIISFPALPLKNWCQHKLFFFYYKVYGLYGRCFVR